MRPSYRIVLLILGMFPLMSTLAFSVPGLISYKGQLTDASGGPITTSVDVTFTLWDAETGGNQLGSGFSDTDSVTPNADGIYDTLIGDDGGDMIPGSIFGNNSVWLNVNVDGEDLSPRTRLTPVGAALHADTAGDADTVDGVEGADIISNTNAIAAIDNSGIADNATSISALMALIVPIYKKIYAEHPTPTPTPTPDPAWRTNLEMISMEKQIMIIQETPLA